MKQDHGSSHPFRLTKKTPLPVSIFLSALHQVFMALSWNHLWSCTSDSAFCRSTENVWHFFQITKSWQGLLVHWSQIKFHWVENAFWNFRLIPAVFNFWNIQEQLQRVQNDLQLVMGQLTENEMVSSGARLSLRLFQSLILGTISVFGSLFLLISVRQ